jgi:hypothetical protein
MKSRLFPAILAAVALVLAGGCGKSPKREVGETQK